MGTRILFISNLYPNFLAPNVAAFNRQQIAAIRRICDVEVISPIPWTALLVSKPTVRVRVDDGITIFHPTYFYIPRFFRKWQGEFFYLSINSIATSLLHKKKIDCIFTSWLYPDAWAAAKIAKRFDLPLFVKVHGTDVNRLMPGSMIARRSLQVVQQAEKVICVSRALKEKLISLGCPESKLEILYNGVDRHIFHALDKQKVRKQLKIESKESLLLYVGNLKEDKGLGELISAFKLITSMVDSQLRLVIIGEGVYRSKSEQLVNVMSLTDKVQFLGSLPLEEVALWMNAASVLCLPSYNEGVPNVILEALSCGAKVVATNVGGIPELDCGNGMLKLVAPKSVDSLAHTIVSILGDDMREAVLPPFILSWEQNAQKLFSIFTRNG